MKFGKYTDYIKQRTWKFEKINKNWINIDIIQPNMLKKICAAEIHIYRFLVSFERKKKCGKLFVI